MKVCTFLRIALLHLDCAAYHSFCFSQQKPQHISFLSCKLRWFLIFLWWQMIYSAHPFPFSSLSCHFFHFSWFLECISVFYLCQTSHSLLLSLLLPPTSSPSARLIPTPPKWEPKEYTPQTLRVVYSNRMGIYEYMPIQRKMIILHKVRVMHVPCTLRLNGMVSHWAYELAERTPKKPPTTKFVVSYVSHREI